MPSRPSEAVKTTGVLTPLEEELELGVEALFKAYDIDESGELSRNEFMKIEMRLCFGEGTVFKEEKESAKMTLADNDRSGQLNLQEFRERYLRQFSEMGLPPEEIIHRLAELTKRTLAERQEMGPRFHAGIRQTLKRIFNLYDTSGDGLLSPEEWISAQQSVAREISDELDESWIDEAAFSAADTNGDGMLSMAEFLDSSFTMLESVKERSNSLVSTLQSVVSALERRRMDGHQATMPLTVYIQNCRTPEFQPPHAAWQDESTVDHPDKHANAWRDCGTIELPVNLSTFEEVASILRLFLKLPDTLLSIFYCGPPQGSGKQPVTLLRGERAGEGNVLEALEYLAKPNAAHRLFVKNVRKRPSKLSRQLVAYVERDALMSRRTGQCWGLDWQTQVVGAGQKLPPLPLLIHVGDAIVVETPTADESGEYTFVCSAFMDGVDVLSKPIEENIQKKKPKKKRSGAAHPDPLKQLSFVALKEGACTMFVDVSWEDQEEKLTEIHDLVTPCAENTIARIGPILVEVERLPQKTDTRHSAAKESVFVWWNGDKWSNKKGPAKKRR